MRIVITHPDWKKGNRIEYTKSVFENTFMEHCYIDWAESSITHDVSNEFIGWCIKNIKRASGNVTVIYSGKEHELK